MFFEEQVPDALEARSKAHLQQLLDEMARAHGIEVLAILELQQQREHWQARWSFVTPGSLALREPSLADGLDISLEQIKSCFDGELAPGRIECVRLNVHAIYHPAGDAWLVLVRSTPLGGLLGEVLARVEPALAEHRRQRTLREAHAQWRGLLRELPGGVAVVQNNQICFANEAFSAQVGRSAADVVGSQYHEYVHPDDREQFVSEYPSRISQLRFSTADQVRASEVVCLEGVSFEGQAATVLCSRDITDEHVAQVELARAEKLSALGALALGVAHELNNPLAYVTLNLQQLLDATAKHLPPTELELLEEALEGAQRMSRIVGELKGFSGADAEQTEPVNVVQAVTSALNIAQNEIRHRARLKREHEPGLFVEAREGQLVQVLVNVLVNAAQAIPSGDHEDHVIQVTSRRAASGRVEIAVSDTGCGMNEAQLQRIFEAFSSVKSRGEGCGLGLAISKRILEQLGGSIQVQSTLGIGTTVTITMLHAAAPLQSFPAEPPTQPMRVPAISARVLIIDDELSVMKGLKRMLSGHEVVLARSGEQALELLAEDVDFDVILCDIMMPGLPGSELYHRITEQRAELAERFVFMTGGAFTQYGRAFLDAIDCPVLQKPFEPRVVIRCVERLALARRQAS